MKRILLLSLWAMLLLSACATRESRIMAELREGFENPPAQARPLTWWHWMNGNITKDGLRKDLEWMKRAGLEGFFLFDAGMDSPSIVENRFDYMSAQWKDAFNYTLDKADSLGLFVGIASSPGWSLTGGPWVSEADAAKKVVWSETLVQGGFRLELALPEPPQACGAYQDEYKFPNDPDKYRWYRDLYVIAMRKPQYDTARIVHSVEKAGFKMDFTITDNCPTPETSDCTALSDVIDLSTSFSKGILSWDAPEGEWKIFRFGCNLIGHQNGPAVPEATGLEVDKLDADAVRRYYTKYFDLYRDAGSNRFGPHGIRGLEIDSYESAKCTWTPRMEEEFYSRRGYSLRPWMPVLTGQIVESAAMSERFLFDWRQTLGELLAENHYDAVNKIIEPLGLIRFNESHEERTAFTGDGMMVKRTADVPMSAFWARFRAGWYATYPNAEADLRESSSVAHIYGQNICAAESFTTNGHPGKWDGWYAYQCPPSRLKPLADAAMAEGLNKFVVHTSVHQPRDDKFPGLGLARYGQWFHRHETWAEEARAWTDYLSRSSFMLQQGRNVADIAYFYGEGKNPTGRFNAERVQIPAGYNYDFINADILCNVLERRAHRVETPSGQSYALIVLDPQLRRISMGVLRRLAEFARGGVAVYGPRPQYLAGMEGSDADFAALVDEVWALDNVSEDGGIAQALLRAGVTEDVQSLPDSCSYVHRKLKSGDVYWVANICSQPREITLSLRAAGRKPELWNAVDASRREVSYRIEGDRTVVTLPMERDDSQFIVMVEKGTAESCSLPKPEFEEFARLEGPWNVTFQEGRGAPESLVFEELMSFTDCPVEGVKYFSGTASYEKRFVCFELPQGPCLLDFDGVGEMAHVFLNGKDLGLLWKEPFMVDVSDALVEGENQLEVRVTNTWGNRLIRDAQPGVTPITYTSWKFYLGTEPLSPSGLWGPVRLLTTRS